MTFSSVPPLAIGFCPGTAAAPGTEETRGRLAGCLDRLPLNAYSCSSAKALVFRHPAPVRQKANHPACPVGRWFDPTTTGR